MFRRLRNAIALALGTSLLAACAGGGGSSSPGLPAHPSGPATASITLRLIIPPKTAAKLFAHRSPQYISPSTTQLVIVINGDVAHEITIPVTCSNPPCQFQATVNAPANQLDTFAITAKDSGGLILSDATVTTTPPPGASNLNVTLGGSVQSIDQVNICPANSANCGAFQQPGTTGQSSSWIISISAARDADGNIIAGPFDAPVPLTLLENTTENTLSLAKSSLATSSDSTTLSYNGSFDGENAPSGTVLANICTPSCQPNGGWAIFETPCPAGTITCTSFNTYAFPQGGFSGVIGSDTANVYVSDGDWLASVASNGATTFFPAILPQTFPGPPKQITQGAGFLSMLAFGGQLYFTEANSVSAPGWLIGSFNPASSSFTEYLGNGGFTTGGAAGYSPAVGSDNNIWVAENGPNFGQYNTGTSVYTDTYSLCSGDPIVFIAALGINIYFVANFTDVNGNLQWVLGSVKVTQNPNTCIPAAKEHNFPSGNPNDPDTIGGIAVAQGLIWATGTRPMTQVSEIFTATPAFAFSTYGLPAGWNGGGTAADLGGIAFNSNDNYMYFDDFGGGIVGRIPSLAPSTANTQGAGTKYHEPAQFLGQPLDPVVVGPTDHNIYFLQSYTATSGTNLTIGILNPALATWTGTPHQGLSLFRIPQNRAIRRPARRSSRSPISMHGG